MWSVSMVSAGLGAIAGAILSLEIFEASPIGRSTWLTLVTMRFMMFTRELLKRLPCHEILEENKAALSIFCAIYLQVQSEKGEKLKKKKVKMRMKMKIGKIRTLKKSPVMTIMNRSRVY
ncbi:hypothetical protein PanWU01x14_271180 [Parasponia andersonii]|uniref:Uncharacterized protein n=1 Tax=Parasponia andersonii TaxID=3476 RepID=A0A2P5B4X5_PARAD|nr:hypothetical protein PanWU01x14_271180 [Parasponia andersonii]